MTSKKTVNLISELESRYLECNICRELFDEEERIPRLLPCHHPFCSECLNKLGRRKDIIKCPTCNAVHKMQKNDPSDFPKDNTRRDLTTFLHAHSDLITLRTCNHCGNTVNVTHKCQQCNIPLCEICQRNHKTENLTHSIILSKSETFPDDDDNLDICLNPRHERAKLKYFCNSSNCQSSVCPSCVIDEHRDSSKHELENIEKAFKKRKKELGNGVKSLRRRISYVESTFQKVSNTLQDERDEFNRELNAIYKRGIGVLEDRKQKVLDVFNIALQKKESRAVTSKDNLDSYLKNATECCNLSEQLINRNNMSSFLNVHQTIDVHLKQYLNTTFENSTDDENHFAKTINFDDILRLFKNNIENLEKSNEDADIEPSIELAKGSLLLLLQNCFAIIVKMTCSLNHIYLICVSDT
ncbi:transcription intermediary factor 1-beta-like [Mytilus trossulus]|uniref:transcription intermediary factor 1-beta-like n=1 Tax=Mytilus trossulus TaxID=6551 RepID=UPI0030048B59